MALTKSPHLVDDLVNINPQIHPTYVLNSYKAERPAPHDFYFCVVSSPPIPAPAIPHQMNDLVPNSQVASVPKRNTPITHPITMQRILTPII
jgi:hypothetical protein